MLIFQLRHDWGNIPQHHITLILYIYVYIYPTQPGARLSHDSDLSYSSYLSCFSYLSYLSSFHFLSFHFLSSSQSSSQSSSHVSCRLQKKQGVIGRSICHVVDLGPQSYPYLLLTRSHVRNTQSEEVAML